MAREHVEFIQSQQLPWAPAPWAHFAGADCKLLSRDAGSGAATALLRLDPGWHRDACGRHDAAEEWLVLEGALRIGADRLASDCYTSRPAGSPCGALSSPEGAVLLAFLDREPHWHDDAPAGAGGPLADPAAGPAAEHPVPTVLDAFELPWQHAGMDPVYGDAGLRWKLLRGAPGEPDMTMLVACPPHLHPPQWRGPQERHDCVEEMFLISGDYLSNVGTMRAGAYFWRPPGIAHGPYGTRFGNLALIRTLGAPLENNWSRDEVAISRDPPLAATVPPALRHVTRSSGWQPPSF